MSGPKTKLSDQIIECMLEAQASADALHLSDKNNYCNLMGNNKQPDEEEYLIMKNLFNYYDYDEGRAEVIAVILDD